MEELFKIPEKKIENFEFKSTKGSDIKIAYTLQGGAKILDKKGFQDHLLKLIDLLECEDKAIVEAPAAPTTVAAPEGETKDEKV